jgi:ubiquinone/menaquinone biosynthesis C-methylase UbiE
MSVFDSIAKDYDSWYKTELGAFVDEVENKLAFNLAPLNAGMKVLDVGCGTGIYTARLVQKGCDVIGIDISEDMLSIARSKLPEVCFVQSSVYGLPFPENKFDFVFSMATFEFIEEFEAAYFEMKRIVKPGGYIFIGTINGDSSWGELYKTKEFQEGTVFGKAFFKTPADIKSLEPSDLVEYGECLYFPPNTKENKFDWNLENELSSTERPGFIAGLWKKNEI